MHNVHMLGIFLISIAERYHRVVEAIEVEEARAREANETKSFGLGDMTSANTHLHSEKPIGTGFSVELAPAEWRRMAKKIVKAEVMGTPDKCCPCFLVLTEQMEARQQQWHLSPPSHDFPALYKDCTIRPPVQNHEEAVCLRLCLEARRIIEHMNFE